MALRKSESAPAFESEDGGVATAEVEREEPVTVAEAAATVLDAAAATVVVAAPKDPRPTSVVASPTSKFALALKRSTVLDELQNVISPEQLESMPFGAFPRVVVDLGGFTNKTKNVFLGTKMLIEILSWNFVTIVTTGENSGNKETDRLVRTSYDGVNLTGGQGKVEDYVAELKAKDYDKATAKRYVEIYAYIHRCEKFGDTAEDDLKITQISISPQSSGPWGVYMLEAKMAANRGKDVTSRVVLRADRKTNGNSQTYGVVNFGGSYDK